MNVLYIGVDNPVTITAGAGSEKVSAQFSGGSISKVGGNKYTVKPGSGMFGEHTITVLVDGKSAGKVTFRIKQLPDPVAYVGNLKPGNVPSASFKAMGGVIAKLQDAEFDAPFEIDNRGSRWTGDAAGLVGRLKPGSLVAITDIVVKDPGGKTRVLPTSLTYILK
jgi:hypothetical protein